MPEGSGSKHLVAIVPENIPVVAAFKTISAHRLMHIERPLDGVDVFIASDDNEAIAKVVEMANSIRHLRGIEVGALLCSASLELMTAVLITLTFATKQSRPPLESQSKGCLRKHNLKSC